MRNLSFFYKLVLLLVVFATNAWAIDCYRVLTDLGYARFLHQSTGKRDQVVVYADGTRVPIARALEKEGLLYRDIADWFPSVSHEAAPYLRERLQKELDGKMRPRNLMRWLKNYAKYFRPKQGELPSDLRITPKKWEALSYEEKLEFILKEPDFFVLLNIRGREEMIYDGILSFDDLVVTENTPPGLTVGDDLGSYEVRSDGGLVDRSKFNEQRDMVEEYLEGKVGHQHKVHAWPKDQAKREMMAPRYIELLDSGTWYLFWRQVKRNPSEVESILGHPFLGVYTRESLNRLYEFVVNNEPNRFNNKFRMIGARRFKSDPKIPEQRQDAPEGEDVFVPDFELRSGNKTDNRDFVEDMIEARIASGDYSGLHDFRDYEFDPRAPIAALTYKWLKPEERAVLEEFEKPRQGSWIFERLEHANSHNHIRTKLIAPLLPWAARLPMGFKRDLLDRAQKSYAKAFYKAAETYMKRVDRWTKQQKKLHKSSHETGADPSIAEWREELQADLETALYRFAKKARLDLDFERYLTVSPTELPSLQVKTTGPIEVNNIDLGIEYSFRYPTEVEINSKAIAEREIQRMVMAMQTEMGGGKIEKLDDGGHGHGASVRYRYTDPMGRVWRAEWDGIQRHYIDGVLMDPHGGHIETPSPKFNPQDARRDLQPLFKAAKKGGLKPSRIAGGGHMNVDLAAIKALPEAEGARKILNLVAFFESNREMITFLWQHPSRLHAARAIELKPGFAGKIDRFDGDWFDLAVMLYKEQYFNPYETRKPRYVEMDITGLIMPAVPEEYKQGSLDIKNPTQEWFPDFGKGKDRVEFRLFDAPVDEYIASLQIKYTRALLNAAFNTPGKIALKPKWEPGIKDRWRTDARAYLEAVTKHLTELGLDINEFKPLIKDSFEMQQRPEREPKPLKKYNKFLPALKRPKKNGDGKLGLLIPFSRGAELGEYSSCFAA